MTRRYIRDLTERALRTYVQTFIGLLMAAGFAADGTIDLSVLGTAAVSAIPAVLSLIMSLLARSVGDSESASLAKPPIVP